MNLKYRHLGTDELELVADDYTSRLESRYFRGPELLIEEAVEAEGFDIWPEEGLAKFSKGYLPFRGRRIFVDQDIQLFEPHEYRFTLAEERAHHLIHAPIFHGWSEQQFTSFRNSLTNDEYLAFEREARYLAAGFLMPRKSFREYVRRFCDVIVAHGGDRYKETEHLYRMLSDAFNVAPLAAERRCQQLDFIVDDINYGVA